MNPWFKTKLKEKKKKLKLNKLGCISKLTDGTIAIKEERWRYEGF